MRRFPRFTVQSAQIPPSGGATIWKFLSKASLVVGLLVSVTALME